MTSRLGYCGERPDVWIATVRRSFGRAPEHVEAGREVSDTQLTDAATVLDNVMRYGVEVDSLLLSHFLTRPAGYHFHGRDWGGLLRRGSVALGAWIRLNGAGDLVRAVFGSVEYVVSPLRQRLRRGPRTPAPAGALRCPCGNCLRASGT
ncbi:hypothetical protein SSPS47_32135 [Streptomyces sp. S4.7]|uniref:hypothetical protein n=1 Tax=Streptomyces sp. S4.7 TaxID=2705439 RepID=UPI001398D08C|nr:hypothetical protein [Streptomyces sp. S4.7]QHY99751.1 hypothetical protein SSPS47_32135 [Streptomyces sp. S4.7]